MDTQASKERKFTQTMEKWIMYFMYTLFGGLFLLISLTFNTGTYKSFILDDYTKFKLLIYS